MNIRLISEVNKATHSINSLIIDDQKFYMTEKDLKALIDQLFYRRDDLIEEKLKGYNYYDELKELKDNISDLSDRLEKYEANEPKYDFYKDFYYKEKFGCDPEELEED